MEHTDSPTAALEAFGDTLEQLSDLMTSLTQMENAKAEAASSGQHGRIDGYLKQEQALILKLRGLEQRHRKQMKTLAWDGLTFRQILEQADEKEEAFLSPLFGRLTEQLRLLTSSRDSANRILNVRLKEFEDALAGSPQPHFRDTYV
ncbi:MAG: flagellar protein FlgN [Lachnospiraceae bacterium]|nr:flagellar protein FlgN [Lachnospiraceae bacterium]